MTDPVAVKNAKRVLATHRIDEVHFSKTPPTAQISCFCGWKDEWDVYVEGDIEGAWSKHKRDVGEPAH